MNQHNFHIILLLFPYLPTAYKLTIVKKKKKKTICGEHYWSSQTCPLGVHYSLWAKSRLLPIYLNKVLLEYSHSHSFTHCLLLFLCYNSKAELLWRRQKNLFSSPLQEKLSDSCFKSPWIYKEATKCPQKRCLPNSLAKTQRREGTRSIIQWRLDSWGNLSLHPCSRQDNGNTSSYNLQKHQPIASFIKATAAATTFLPAWISRECREKKMRSPGRHMRDLKVKKVFSVMW